jgi:hypothetical protein
VLGWFQLGQLAYALFVVLLVAERVHVLCWRAPLSEAGLRFLLGACAAGDQQAVDRFCAARPDSHAARILRREREGQGDEAIGELLADLYEEAGARLLALRVSATLASTTGLLGGILALAGGGTAGAGLLALKAGEAQRHSLSEAITTMAIGVALSAVCFQALAQLRPAAQRLVAQDAALARAATKAPRSADEGAKLPERADADLP